MNLYFRFLWLVIYRYFCPKPMDPFGTCETQFRVSFFDLDFNAHMNNGRYFSIMDLGRFDLLLRARLFWPLFMKGYYPVVVSESIRFKQSLEPFQRFTLTTRIESWDEKDLFMIQQFIRDGKVVAEGYLKGRFRKRGQKGSIPTAEIFAFSGQSFKPGALSELAKCQNAVEEKLAVRSPRSS